MQSKNIHKEFGGIGKRIGIGEQRGRVKNAAYLCHRCVSKRYMTKVWTLYHAVCVKHTYVSPVLMLESSTGHSKAQGCGSGIGF